MELTLVQNQDHITVQATCPTVVRPGDDVYVRLNIQTQAPIQIIALRWNTPVALTPEPQVTPFPLSLSANSGQEIVQIFHTDTNSEAFGEIEVTMEYRAGSAVESAIMLWRHWISVFRRVTEDDAAGLSGDSRDKLVGVVNARLTNGFLYMADFVKFFDHYLNIDIPSHLATRIAKELDLLKQEIPVDEETFHRIAIGEVSFYGIEKFELIPEEECEESDDRFDADAIREVVHPVVDI